MAPGEKIELSNVIDFPHFDILSGSDHSDHYYNQFNKSKNVFSNPTSGISKTIAKEWKRLQKNLPESIYVRAYEDKIDLLRAVIVGSPGTPYHDGLFFFDIVFPSDYPNKPPKMRYHAHGMRLNPNLYSSGFVCLSLLRTWYGSGTELWTKNSTILQLLVSIQGLVLNDKPYFNEPGYGKALKNMNESWMKRSMAYNEDVFISSCKTMLHKMEKPPKGFESFILAHFRSHGDFILAAITAYRNGDAVAGQYNVVGSTGSSSSFGVSRKFSSKLAKIHSDLMLALCKIDPSVEIQKKKEENGEAQATLERRGSAGNSKGLLGKIFKVLKKIFD